MISDQNLLSPGRQISNIDFPTLYPYSQASVTTQPTQQSHLASHLLNPSSQNIQIFDPSPNSDSYCSSNQSTQPDSSVSPDPHTLPRQNPKKKTKSHPCPSCARSFVRSSDLQRHFSNIHLQIRHHCAIPFCGNNGGKGYCRVEKLQRHLRKQHKLFVIG